ncbi:hypothetical protein SSAG_05570 [Streptomyces sp. Mg1]|nr:hypothetical protein SSAG_05570 [Streptomyces sp. Mg1]
MDETPRRPRIPAPGVLGRFCFRVKHHGDYEFRNSGVIHPFE